MFGRAPVCFRGRAERRGAASGRLVKNNGALAEPEREVCGGPAGRPNPRAADYATVNTTLSKRSSGVLSPSVPLPSNAVCVPGFWLSALCTVHVYCLPDSSSAKLETL